MSTLLLFLTAVLFSNSISLSLCLPGPPCPLCFFSSLVTQMETHTWGLRLHCGQENQDHTGAMNCSTVPLPLLLLLGHGNLTNNGKERRDGGHVEEGRKQRTGNHVLKETEKKWTRRLWSTCRNSGMKTWRAPMQLKVRVNWKPVCCRWKAFNNIPEKHKHTRARTFRCCDLASDPVGNYI